MKSIHFCLNAYYLLSFQNQLFKLTPNSPTPVQLYLPSKTKKILQVFNSERTLILLCDIGVYYLGENILGKGLTFTMQAVEGLEQVRFINASITSTHAAGIDDLGNLYIWGGIHGKPHLVEASKAFTSARVVCAEDFIYVCTGGGYVYLFGELGKGESESVAVSIERSGREKRENNEELPYTLPGIEKLFIVDICIGKGFCGVLTEEGVVLCFDWTRDLVTMPEGKSVQAIYSFDYGIIGVSPGVLYKWYGSTVREWQLEIFKTGEIITVLGSLQSGIVVQGDCRIEYIRNVEACGMSIETQNIIASLGESRENPLSIYSSPRALTSPYKENLYTNFFPADDTFNKLLSCRKQHKQAETIVSIIRPIIAPRLEFAWFALSSFAESKGIMSRTAIYTLLPIATERIIRKIRYAYMDFAFERIGRVFRVKLRKEAEVYKIVREKKKNRIERFGGLLKEIMKKSEIRIGQYLMDEIKNSIEIEKQKHMKIGKLFYLSNKIQRYYLRNYNERWVKKCSLMCNYRYGLTSLCKLAFKRLGSHALESIKVISTHQFQQNTALKLISKMLYMKTILKCFTKWSNARPAPKVRKNISKRLYVLLAKNIFSVINHRMKNNVKYSFNRIGNSYLNCKLITVYKKSLLYFATVASKILCRLKFSTFTAIQRTKHKCNITVNTHSSETLSNLYFTLEAIYLYKLQYFMDLIKNEIKITSVSLNSIVSDYSEQSMTYTRHKESLMKSPADAQETIPKLVLKGLQNSKKPPLPARSNIKNILKSPVKAPIRSGSFSRITARDDSLTRRINYDNQLRKKQKDNEKILKKSETYKEGISLIKGKPKKITLQEITPYHNPDEISNSESLTNQSLGIFSLKAFVDQKLFKLILKSFTVMKKCYKCTKSPQPRCIKYPPEKLYMKDYHFS